MRLFFALIACFVALPASAQVWVDAGGRSCEAACSRSGMSPVVSGIYYTGEPFHMCAANANGEGFRGGYSLGRNSSSCTVGYGGRETAIASYSCMCASGPGPVAGPGAGFNPGFGAGTAQSGAASSFQSSDDEKIRIEDASVGANCGLPRGNATGHVRRHCNGYARCDYIVDRALFGGGMTQCVEDFNVTYSCGSRRQRTASIANVSTMVTVPISCE